ncbi:MAG: NRAMP family divalent metal transporter [Methylophilus sp.]|uniref:NRAMP family divalent metal transporter n=1 Tax=Methylophilus sp. TaxID=29541 RepID=UPI0040358645
MFKSFLKKLGPGLITGAADDDPSGIATYSQAGAQFGTSMLWSIIFTYPLMVAIQMISAIIGRASGKGLAGNMRQHYPRSILYLMVSLLLIANVINIGADLAAMGDALKLLFGGSELIYAIFFGLLSLLLQIFIPYKKYVRVLKWLTLALLAYVATLFLVKLPTNNLMQNIFAPDIHWDKNYITTLVAIFGTTISPYLFFWQASQEVEEIQQNTAEKPLIKAPEQTARNMGRIKLDTMIGMGFSNLVAFCIILTAAITLHTSGITNIETSADAAKALKPIAGEFAFLLFSVGIIGTGLLAIPVLAGSAAYAMSGAFDWDCSLELAPGKAKRFYAVIGVSVLVGIGLCMAPISPIKALYWSAVINGVLAIPIMVLMMFMAHNKKIVGDLKVSNILITTGWGCTLAMIIAVGMMGCTFMY